MNHQSYEELFEDGRSGQLHQLRNDLLLRGVDVIDCGMINPDLAPPRILLDKLLESVVKLKNHRYAVARGIRKLREGFSIKYRDAFKVQIDPESEVCVTLGAKDALLQSLRVGLSQVTPKRRGGAPKRPRVLMGLPFYPVHRSAALLAGAEPVFFPLVRDPQQLYLNIEAAVDKYRPHVLVVNFPNNPTGAVVDRAFYERLALLSERFEFLVVNDFVYGELEFTNGQADSLHSSAAIRERGVEIYSLSKCLSIPGWRVGCVIGSQTIVERIAQLKSHSDYGLFLPFQYAAAFALQAGDALIEPQRTAYCERARVIVGGLRRRGWSVDEAQGGAAVWVTPPSSHARLTSSDLARLLLERFGVLVSPGEMFGSQECAVRIALVAPPERLRELLTRLEGIEESLVASDSPIISRAKVLCESL